MLTNSWVTDTWSFLLTLAILIVVHEWGHYRAAVACGIKVLRFSFGFGPVMWRWQRGETEFVVSAFPLGGYVRMVDAREGPVDPVDLPRAFTSKPLWQRSWVVLAGPLANLVLAALLFAGTFWWGVQVPVANLSVPPTGSPAAHAGVRSGDRVTAVAQGDQSWEPVESLDDLNWMITTAVLNSQSIRLQVTDLAGAHHRELALDLSSQFGKPVDRELMSRAGLMPYFRSPSLADVIAHGPADKAGLKAGDQVLSINGLPLDDTSALFDAIRGSHAEDQPLDMLWRVKRGKEVFEVKVTPKIEREGELHVAKVAIKIGGVADKVEKRYGFADGLLKGVSRTFEMAWLNVKMIGELAMGRASVKNLGGSFSIADMAGQAAMMGLLVYVGFIASMSATLGALNLLPVPALDGGHLMYHLFEWVTGRPIPEVWLERLQRGGLAVLLLMMSLAHYNDVVRFWFHP